MNRSFWKSENLFFWAFALYLCMQFAVTAAAPHTLWFYGIILPAALFFLWQHRESGIGLTHLYPWRWMMAFFTYIVIHALLFDDGHASKVVRNTVATALFVSLAALFFGTVSEAARRRLLSAIGLVAGVCAAASIFLYYFDADAEARLRPIGRADAQVLGAFLYTIGAICALAALCHCQQLWLRWGLCLAVALCFATVMLTQSRMALVVMLLALVLGGAFLCRRHPGWLLGALVAAMGISAITAHFMSDGLFSYIDALVARGDSDRMALWVITLDKIQQAPWIGYGMMARIDYAITETYRTNSPHNAFLTTALAVGVPGLVVLLMALCSLCWNMLIRLRLIDHGPFFVWLLIVNGLASGMIDHSRIVKGPSPLWIIFWLPLAMGIGELLRTRLKATTPA